MIVAALVMLHGWIPLGAEYFVLLVAVAIVTELELQSVWRATTVASFDRTIAALSMLYLALAVVVTLKTVDLHEYASCPRRQRKRSGGHPGRWHAS